MELISQWAFDSHSSPNHDLHITTTNWNKLPIPESHYWELLQHTDRDQLLHSLQEYEGTIVQDGTSEDPKIEFNNILYLQLPLILTKLKNSSCTHIILELNYLPCLYCADVCQKHQIEIYKGILIFLFLKVQYSIYH